MAKKATKKAKKKKGVKKVPGAGLKGRPHPPENMGPEEATLWVAIVNTRPADYFGEETQALLEEYVGYVIQGRKLKGLILFKWEESESGNEYLDTKDLKRLVAMAAQVTSKIVSLARSMRLTQQSIYLPDSSAGKGKPKDLDEKPWEFTGRKLKSVK